MIELIDDALKIKKKRIVEIEEEKYSIVGDIHGDYESLKKILKKAVRPVIFLGDYGDRGDRQIEVYMEILRGYADGDYILLRGNHETTTAFPHDLPYRLRDLENWEEVYRRIKDFWESLPWCGIANCEVFAVHGGIYTKECRIVEDGITLQELKDERAFIELIWNDPWDREGCDYNHERGIGYLFGKKATRVFMENLDLKVVVRSHQPYKILKAEQDGMVVTVGSTRVYGNGAAFLSITGKFRDGYSLAGKYGFIV